MKAHDMKFRQTFILFIILLLTSCKNTIVTQIEYIVFSVTPEGQGFASVSVFDPEVNEYRFTLPYETTTTTFSTPTSSGNIAQLGAISGTTADGDALTVRTENSVHSISGLETGENSLTVEILSEDGSRSSYSITIEVLDFLNLRESLVDSENSEYEFFGAGINTSIVIGNTTYLYVCGARDHGISVFEVTPRGTLIHRSRVQDSDNASYELEGVWELTTATIGTKPFLFASGYDDDGISVFEIGTDGSLTNTDNETDGGSLELDGAAGITVQELAGKTFLFVSGLVDNGVSVFEVSGTGTLTSRANVDDSANAAYELQGARDVETLTIGTRTFLFVAGSNDAGISVFEIANNGTLTYRNECGG